MNSETISDKKENCTYKDFIKNVWKLLKYQKFF